MSTQRSVEDLTDELDAIHEGDARAPLLIELLGRARHERHEDIVFELGLIGSPSAVPAIARAAVSPYPYLEEWGNLHEFQRKCAYALARIATSDSRAALEQMAKSSDPHLHEYGMEGLEHWPLPFQRR
jgi:hypothetical protein